MIKALIWSEFLKTPKTIVRALKGRKSFFGRMIQNNFEILYVPQKSRFLTPKFQKIFITRAWKKFFSSQIQNNHETPFAPQKSRFLFLKSKK